jgi:hypothetical protein
MCFGLASLFLFGYAQGHIKKLFGQDASVSSLCLQEKTASSEGHLKLMSRISKYYIPLSVPSSSPEVF